MAVELLTAEEIAHFKREGYVRPARSPRGGHAPSRSALSAQHSAARRGESIYPWATSDNVTF